MKKRFIMIFLISLQFINCDTSQEIKECSRGMLMSEKKVILSCQKYFWRFYPLVVRDTLTVFKDYSFCIESLPNSFYNLSNLKVIILDTETSLKELSSKISNFKNLEKLVIQKSQLRKLPTEIVELKSLEYLSISWGGQLQSLPENIGKMQSLKTLNLYRNELSTLPTSIQELKNLEYLQLGENNFSEEEKERIKSWLPNCEVKFEL